ncbi:hypothetical protein Tco_1224069 [Tanacetum coccineum]
MDKHIELEYCSFEAFKVLAYNYLYLESHVLFDKIHVMLEEVDMTPADVAENLMPKTSPGDPEGCLSSLIRALEAVKLKKVEEEEERKKAEITKSTQEEKNKSVDEENKVLYMGHTVSYSKFWHIICLYLESHVLFEIILAISEELDTTPTYVVKNLMPKTSNGYPEGCLNNFISALKRVKLKKMDEKQAFLRSSSSNLLPSCALVKKNMISVFAEALTPL